MTVEELIIELQKYPQDAEVYIDKDGIPTADVELGWAPFKLDWSDYEESEPRAVMIW